jgi:hypothetical protein
MDKGKKMMLKQTCFCNGRKIYKHLGPPKDEQEQATTATLQPQYCPHPHKINKYIYIKVLLFLI